MANLSNVRLLNVSPSPPGSSLESATIQLSVSWTANEVNENLWYRLNTYLIERDGARDVLDLAHGGDVIRVRAVGNSDDYVGHIRGLWIRPNGLNTRDYTLTRHFNFGGGESGLEEYVGLATILPEIHGDIQYSSNERSGNYGGGGSSN